MTDTGEAADELRHLVPDVETLARRLAGVDYLVDEGLATSMFLGLRLPPAAAPRGRGGRRQDGGGQGARRVLDTPLVRLQCYDGIDAAEALYEWNYPRQLLAIRLADATAGADRGGPVRPRLPDPRGRCCRRSSIPGPRPAVLLIDEIDRADDDFEAFLLELLAEAAVTIPSSGRSARRTRRRSC